MGYRVCWVRFNKNNKINDTNDNNEINENRVKSMNKIKVILFFIVCFYSGSLNAAAWEDWELGGELGIGTGSGSNSGRILCPLVRITGTRTMGIKFVELGIGYMYGSQIVINYPAEDVDEANFEADEEDDYIELVADAGQDVKVRMSIIPMTVNFYYTIFKHFYVGGGVGMYHVFYKKEPLGNYRVNPEIDSEKGKIVKSPSTTALGFQQLVGVEIFPMSKKWNWFIGLKSFFTTAGGPSGGLMGITFGGKVRYTW